MNIVYIPIHMDTCQNDLMFPILIDKGRILDLYSMLNGGMTISETSNTSNSSNEKMTNSGSIGAGISIIKGDKTAAVTNENQGVHSSGSVRAPTLLSMLKEIVNSGKINHLSVKDLEPHSFAVIDVNFMLSSLRNPMEKMANLLLSVKTINEGALPESKMNTEQAMLQEQFVTNLESIVTGVNQIMDEQLVMESEEFVVRARLDRENLYNSKVDDLIGYDLRCLCYIRRIREGGGKLQEGLPISIANNTKDLENAVSAMNSIEDFNLGAVFMLDTDKTIYDIAVIALF